MQSDRRWAIIAIVALVAGFVGAGVWVLRNELSPDDDARPPGAWETAWEYVTAFDERKAGAAAELTTDPKAAAETLRRVFRKLPDATVSSALGEVKTAGDKASATVAVEWTFGDGRTFSYPTKVPLVQRSGTWLVDFSPAVVHPELEEGQYIAVADKVRVPAVVDSSGEPLLVWGDVGPQPVKENRAKVVLPAMLTAAQERKPPERWAVVAMKGKNTRVRILSGDGPQGAKPLPTTLSIPLQDAAQAAVDTQRKPAALIAFRPSTGALVAVAQNKHVDQGPISLSGLYPPGSTFSLVRVAAENESAGAIARAASSLGWNADFDIPGIGTEAGAVRKAGDSFQLADQLKGQGDVFVSPFGLALVVSTVAKAEAVTPQFWKAHPTKVLTGYQAPDEETLAAVREHMRTTVTEGEASSLKSLSSGEAELHAVTGTARAGGGKRHSWFAGYAGDLAFAVLVEDGGSEKAALSVAGKFLRERP